ncbi:radical SAM family heme chaperone HemW [Povalibacter sp.]|uniref:radical SAM family heme chaperone HemW n=1 Tax=Povalibacter sp. TaxID=1962978 RepID=UPI002F3FEEAF
MFTTLPPLSLYVHLPWCVRKCPYCDFNSHAAPENVPQRDYVDALLEDLDLDLATAAPRPLISIFFGGGTPSLFSPEEIGRFLAGVGQRMACASDMEVTLEANPGTIEHGRFRGYRDAGVTRVSLGAQTFNDQHLKALGRIHGSNDIQRAVDELRQAGLDNFNLDLMYGLPQQSREQAVADVATAIELQPAHLSHYQLTLEPGTVFYHRPPPLPDHDATWDMQLECQALLAQHGYEQYEVSAYARAGRRCRHNINYWQFGDYLGIGAGAHAKLTNAGVERTVRCRQPRDYLGRAPADRVTERRAVSGSELSFEFMLNALRLRDGFAISQFEERTGLPMAAIDSELRSAQARGLMKPVPGAWEPTELGFRFLNDLQEMFLPGA